LPRNRTSKAHRGNGITACGSRARVTGCVPPNPHRLITRAHVCSSKSATFSFPLSLHMFLCVLPPLSVRHTFTFATPSPLLFSSGFPHPLFRTMMTGCGHPLLQLATPPSPRGFPPIARVHHRLGPTALCQGRPRGGAVSFEHLRPKHQGGDSFCAASRRAPFSTL
jgi:hypothetical protein